MRAKDWNIKMIKNKVSVGLQGVKSDEKTDEAVIYTDSVASIRQALSQKGRPLQAFAEEFEAKYKIERPKSY